MTGIIELLQSDGITPRGYPGTNITPRARYAADVTVLLYGLTREIPGGHGVGNVI
jgi:hypothetical protein